MKKNYLIIFFVFLSLNFIFVACEKSYETNNSINYKDNINKNTNIISDKYEIKKTDEMLEFKNINEFREVYNNIVILNQKYQENIYNLTKNLAENDLNNYYSENKIDDFLIFRNFEKFYNFKSLRLNIETLDNEYNMVFDQSKIENPDNHYIYDLALRTLLNPKCEVKIGSSIFVFYNEKLTIEVFNSNKKVLEMLNDENLEDLEKSNKIKIYGNYCPDCKEDCRENISTDWDVMTWWDGNIKRKIEGKIVVFNNAIIFTHFIEAKTNLEYWDGNSWRNWRSNIYTQIEGNIYEKNNCDKFLGYRAKSEIKENSYYNTVTTKMNGIFFSVKSNEVKSEHTVGDYSLLINLIF